MRHCSRNLLIKPLPYLGHSLSTNLHELGIGLRCIQALLGISSSKETVALYTMTLND